MAGIKVIKQIGLMQLKMVELKRTTDIKKMKMIRLKKIVNMVKMKMLNKTAVSACMSSYTAQGFFILHIL